MGSLKIGSSSTTTRIGVSSSSSVLTGIYKPFKYSCDVSETSKRRQRRRLFLGATIENNGGYEPTEDTSLVIKSVAPSKVPAQPPTMAPIERTSTYLLRNRRTSGEEVETSASSKLTEDISGRDPENAVDWALSKVDRSLQEIEEDPPVYAKFLYEITSGPVGTTAGKGVVAAARFTGKVGGEAIKAAAPVGKWVLSQSFKMVATAAAQSLDPRKKKKQNSENKPNENE